LAALSNPYRPFRLAGREIRRSNDRWKSWSGSNPLLLPAAREFSAARERGRCETMRVRIGGGIVAQALRSVPDSVTLKLQSNAP
jgi:hypothetical protein